MKISMKSRYAIRFLKELEKNYIQDPGRFTPVREVSIRQEISEKFLQNIANQLKLAGLIIGEKGSKGGYALAKPPEEIGLGDIFNIMETDYMVIRCKVSEGGECPNSETGCELCPFHNFLHDFSSNLSLPAFFENSIKLSSYLPEINAVGFRSSLFLNRGIKSGYPKTSSPLKIKPSNAG